MNHMRLFDGLVAVIEGSGRQVFVGEATGDPEEPYAVLNADWEPQPDVGQELLTEPSTFRASIQINSYGRNNRDALWMDGVVYTLVMRPDQTFPGVNVVWREAEDSPVLTRTRPGLILCKHWYRIAYSSEDT